MAQKAAGGQIVGQGNLCPGNAKVFGDRVKVGQNRGAIHLGAQIGDRHGQFGKGCPCAQQTCHGGAGRVGQKSHV